jgi:hypothetical protein
MAWHHGNPTFQPSRLITVDEIEMILVLATRISVKYELDGNAFDNINMSERTSTNRCNYEESYLPSNSGIRLNRDVVRGTLPVSFACISSSSPWCVAFHFQLFP